MDIFAVYVYRIRCIISWFCIRALIERDDGGEAIRIDLFDKGSGSDQIANDGIYSRYFTRYDGFDGRYTLRCQVKGDENTNFVTSKNGVKAVDIARYVRSYPLKPSSSNSPVCCGSSIGTNIETEPTGEFTRRATGNSFTVSLFMPILLKDNKYYNFRSLMQIVGSIFHQKKCLI